MGWLEKYIKTVSAENKVIENEKEYPFDDLEDIVYSEDTKNIEDVKTFSKFFNYFFRLQSINKINNYSFSKFDDTFLNNNTFRSLTIVKDLPHMNLINPDFLPLMTGYFVFYDKEIIFKLYKEMYNLIMQTDSIQGYNINYPDDDAKSYLFTMLKNITPERFIEFYDEIISDPELINATKISRKISRTLFDGFKTDDGFVNVFDLLYGDLYDPDRFAFEIFNFLTNSVVIYNDALGNDMRSRSLIDNSEFSNLFMFSMSGQDILFEKVPEFNTRKKFKNISLLLKLMLQLKTTSYEKSYAESVPVILIGTTYLKCFEHLSDKSYYLDNDNDFLYLIYDQFKSKYVFKDYKELEKVVEIIYNNGVLKKHFDDHVSDIHDFYIQNEKDNNKLKLITNDGDFNRVINYFKKKVKKVAEDSYF